MSHATTGVALNVALTFLGNVSDFEADLADWSPGAIVGNVTPSVASLAGEGLALTCFVSALSTELAGGMQMSVRIVWTAESCQRQIRGPFTPRIVTAISCNAAGVGVEMRLHLFLDHDSQALDKSVDVLHRQFRLLLVIVGIVGFVSIFLAFRPIP